MSTRLETRDGLAFIHMDDGKANALNAAMLGGLHACFDEALHQKAIILAGRAGFFSGGLDLKSLPGLAPDALEAVVGDFLRMVNRLWESPVPVVAAVSGHAIAGGAVFTLCCDYVLAAEGPFRVGLNEAAIGIAFPPVVLEMAGLRLNRAYLQRALVHGEVFPLSQAREVGFYDEVVTPDALAVRATEVAQRLAQIPPPAYQATKRMVRRLTADTDDLKQAILGFFRSQQA